MPPLTGVDGRTPRASLVICLALAVAGCAAPPVTRPSLDATPTPQPTPPLGIAQQRERPPVRPAPWFATCRPCPTATTKTPVGNREELIVNAEQPAPAPGVDPGRRDSGAPAGREPLHTVHFAFDSAEVASSDAATLAERLPALAGRPVTVVGHTDSVGPRRYNDDLALRRARAVGDILVSLGTLSADIHVEGKGRCCYRAPNDTTTGRAMNRRAEIFTGARPSLPRAGTAFRSPH